MKYYRRLLLVGYLAWGLPLLVATVVLLGYWLTRAPIFLEVGFLLLLVGFICTLFGLISVREFLRLNRSAPESERKQGRQRGQIANVLLLLNFPIAFLYLLIGIDLAGHMYLEIVNDTPYSLDQVVVFSSNERLDLGAMRPGEEVKTYFSPKAEGKVTIGVTAGPEYREAVLTEYAAIPSFHDRKILISNDLKFSIQSIKGVVVAP